MATAAALGWLFLLVVAVVDPRPVLGGGAFVVAALPAITPEGRDARAGRRDYAHPGVFSGL